MRFSKKDTLDSSGMKTPHSVWIAQVTSWEAVVMAQAIGFWILDFGVQTFSLQTFQCLVRTGFVSYHLPFAR